MLFFTLLARSFFLGFNCIGNPTDKNSESLKFTISQGFIFNWTEENFQLVELLSHWFSNVDPQ